MSRDWIGPDTERRCQPGVRALHHPAEVAVIVRRSISWVYAELAAGRLRSVRVGRSRLVRTEDLEAYLAGDRDD